MKPAPFDYQALDSLEAVLALKAEHGEDAKILAGGQSLVPAMNFRLAQPTLLLDINGVPGLDDIRVEGDGSLAIGAMARQRSVELSADAARQAPLLHETMPFIAHPQIRNRGTIGGSLAHADPASELPVVALASGARFKAVNANGERWIDAADFFFGMFMTDLAEDEILAEVAFPSMPDKTGWSFIEIARRSGDYAMMGVAVLITLDESGKCADATLVYLNAGDGPMPAPEAAAMLAGETLSDDLAQAVASKAAQDEIEPFGNIHASEAYARHLAEVVTRRALGVAFQRAANGK